MSKSMDKSFALVELVASGHETLTDLAEASNMPVSTVHRLATMLVKRGILGLEARRYRLGYKLMELGERAKQQLRIPTVAKKYLELTTKQTSETTHLGALDGTHIIYLEKIEGIRGLQLASYIGSRIPAQTTAIGKTLIAFKPRETWESHLLDITPRTPHTITDRSTLLRELEQVRKQGYALDREENEVGVRCVAAPIWDSVGNVIVAVSISGAAIYISEERQKELIPEVCSCANKITRELGGERFILSATSDSTITI